MKQYLLFVFLAFAATTATAQFKTIANQDTIQLRYYKFVKGQEVHHYGFMNRNLGNILKTNEQAGHLFRQSNRSRMHGALIATAGAAICLTGLYGGFENPNTGYAMVLGSVPFAGAGLYYAIKSNKELKKAVYTWNRE